jgi:hypothetical protein
LVGKPKGKRPLGRPRHRWEDGIRMHLREIGLGGGGGLDSTGSGQGPVAGCCESGDEPSGSCATELVLIRTAVTDSFFTNYRTQQLLCCGVAIFKLMASRAGTQQQSPRSYETKL